MSQNQEDMQPGSSQGVRVTLDIPVEAAEALRKLLESAEADSATEEIGEIGVASLQFQGEPAVKIKSFNPDRPVVKTEPGVPSTASASSASALASSSTGMTPAQKQRQQLQSELLRMHQNKISWKTSSQSNKIRSNLDKSMKVKGMSDVQRALALNALAASDPSLNLGTSPLLVNLLKQESDSFSEKTNGLDRQLSKMRANQSYMNGDERGKSKQVRNNKLGSASEADKSTRLKLKLPFDISQSNDEGLVGGGGHTVDTPSNGQDGARKIPKLILSVKDRTIIKKNAAGSSATDLQDSAKGQNTSSSSSSRSPVAKGSDQDTSLVNKATKAIGPSKSVENHTATNGETTAPQDPIEPRLQEDAKDTPVESKIESPSNEESNSSEDPVASKLTNGGAAGKLPNPKMVPVKLVPVSGEGNIRLVRVSPVTAKTNEQANALKSLPASTTVSTSKKTPAPQATASSALTTSTPSPSVPSSSSIPTTSSSTSSPSTASQGLSATEQEEKLRQISANLPPGTALLNGSGTHKVVVSSNNDSSDEKARAKTSTKLGSQPNLNDRSLSPASSLASLGESITIIPSNSSMKHPPPSNGPDDDVDHLQKRQLLSNATSKARPALKRKIISPEDLKRLAEPRPLKEPYMASQWAQAEKRIATRSTKSEELVSKGRKT